MDIRNLVVTSLILLVGGCLNNPTIDQEIARKCGISVGEYRRIESELKTHRDTAPVHAGKCFLKRTNDGNIKGEF